MNIPAALHLALPTSLAMILLADTTATSGAPVGSAVAQTTAIGLLGWLVWYLVAKTFPAHTDALLRVQTAFLKETQEARENATAAQSEFCRSISRLSDTMDRMEQLCHSEHEAEQQHRRDCRAVRETLHASGAFVVNQQPVSQQAPTSPKSPQTT